MIQHFWTVLCQRSIVDSVSNNVSLIDIFESLRIESVAQADSKAILMVPFTFYLVTLWGRKNPETPCQGRARDIILSPKGKKIVEQEHDIDLTEHARTRHTRRIERFPIEQSGQYKFRTQIRDNKRSIWKTVSEVPLEVVLS